MLLSHLNFLKLRITPTIPLSGGLSWQTTPDSLREYFATFGEVKEATVMKDPNTLRSRGFGFVTYKDPLAVDKVTAQSHHELDGKRIDPKGIV